MRCRKLNLNAEHHIRFHQCRHECAEQFFRFGRCGGHFETVGNNGRRRKRRFGCCFFIFGRCGTRFFIARIVRTAARTLSRIGGRFWLGGNKCAAFEPAFKLLHTVNKGGHLGLFIRVTDFKKRAFKQNPRHGDPAKVRLKLHQSIKRSFEPRLAG